MASCWAWVMVTVMVVGVVILSCWVGVQNGENGVSLEFSVALLADPDDIALVNQDAVAFIVHHKHRSLKGVKVVRDVVNPIPALARLVGQIAGRGDNRVGRDGEQFAVWRIANTDGMGGDVWHIG